MNQNQWHPLLRCKLTTPKNTADDRRADRIQVSGQFESAAVGIPMVGILIDDHSDLITPADIFPAVRRKKYAARQVIRAILPRLVHRL
jgi:hypothetical protein